MFSDSTARTEQQGSGARVAPGTVLRDRFVLEEQLQHGRFGAVYRAVDRQRSSGGFADSRVAVLLLPPEIVRNDALLQTFRNEFSSVQSLTHPNIVGIYDLDRDGDTHFLIMELVDGESLRSIVDSLAPELLWPEEALGVVGAIGEALVYAHHRGIVHGDIRADNVLVTAEHEVKVLFTSACLLRSAPFEVEPRDDVYGLAALAYELLSGELPPAAGLQSMHRRPVAGEEPQRIKSLSRRRWKALRAALAVRDQRTRSVRQFLSGLDLPAPARYRRPPSGPRRVQAAIPSRRSGLARRLLRRAAIAVVLLAGLVGVVAGVLQIGRERIAALPAKVAATLQATETQDRGTPTESGAAQGDVAVAQGDAPVAQGDAAAGSDGEAGAGTAAARIEGRPQAGVPDPRSAQVAGGQGVPASASPTADSAAVPENERSVPDSTPAPAVGPTPGGASLPAPQTGTAVPLEREPETSQSLPVPPRESPREPPPQRRSRGVAAAPPAAIEFGQQQLVATEGQSVVAVEIRRADGTGPAAAVWWTSDATATANDDYADFGRVIEKFGDGERSRTVYIPITSDALPESRESFNINLSRLSAQGAQQGELRAATVTIVDDD